MGNALSLRPVARRFFAQLAAAVPIEQVNPSDTEFPWGR